jgi:hypothetical protein
VFTVNQAVFHSNPYGSVSALPKIGSVTDWKQVEHEEEILCGWLEMTPRVDCVL